MARYKDAEREQMREETRRRLLEAALAELAAHGYAGANINRISQAAGLAQGTVYNYFSSKQALYEAVIGDIAAQHTALILQGTAGATDPAARLERFFAAGLAFAQGLPAAAQVIATALSSPDAESRAHVRRAYERVESYVREEIVQIGLLERSFRPIDVELATALILAVHLSGCGASEHAACIRQNPKAAAALLLHGLRSPAPS